MIDKPQNNSVRYIPFKNREPLTPVAPQWNFYVGERYLGDIDTVKLGNFLLSKEEEVLSKDDTDSLMKGYVSDKDGNLTAGTTNALGSYNLFKWDNSEIKKLKDSISEFHKQYCIDCLNIPPFNVNILGWMNIMRKGCNLIKHTHGFDSASYISGNFVVACDNTNTIYLNPYEHDHVDNLMLSINAGENVNDEGSQRVYVTDNMNGVLALFPSYVPHWTTKNESNNERITLAFDLTPFNRAFHENPLPYIPL